MSEVKPPFLKRVRIENFKSIRQCDVELEPLTLLVGPNGSGKTNFLDALRFVGELLRRPPEEVVRLFGGTIGDVPAVFRQELGLDVSGEIPATVHISLDVDLSSGQEVAYSLELGPVFAILEESCAITDQSGASVAHYHVRHGEIVSNSLESPPPVFKNRPYLTSIASFPPFDAIHRLLQSMQFYAIRPDAIREQNTTVHDLLTSDGSGLACVLGRAAISRPAIKRRIDDYLRTILPSVRGTSIVPWVEAVSIAGELSQKFGNRDLFDLYFVPRDSELGILGFGPRNMSDGTLHALGVLVALFQCRDLPEESAIPLVAIEEPEANLHPGAAEVLMDAMTEATSFTQVMATTHSPDFLDYRDLDPESLLVFDASEGETVVAKADEASKAAIRDKLYTAGELLRLEQLKPQMPRTPK